MLTELRIRDYQSLKQADLQLGRLTVVTGPSSSGKTALIRALRLLAFNARGTSYIRRGATSCAVQVREYNLTAGIERGARGKDAYQLTYTDVVMGDPTPVVQTYTKLGGKVPENVSLALKLDEINFAGQFDRPYLLTDSAGEVARKLGELTNVTTIFAAAREANLRRQRLGRQLEDARTEEAALRTDIQRFRGLRARQQAAQQATAALERYEETLSRAGQLRLYLVNVERAQHRLGQLRPLPPEPSLVALEAVSARRTRLQQLTAAVTQASEAETRAVLAVEGAEAEEGRYAKELAEHLRAAGVCPTCGQPIGRNYRD